MSKTLQLFQKEEYDKFKKSLLSDWSIEDPKLTSWEQKIKPIHKHYLSLACAATIVGQRINHKEYSHSIVEASHMSIVLTLKGLKNPAYVLLRQIIELSLKHIYFLSHPVEYSWTINRLDYRDLTFQGLLEYLGRTDQHKLIKKNGLDICDALAAQYPTLSRYVHVHSQKFMAYKAPSIASGLKSLTDLEMQTKSFWTHATILLLIFYPQKYLNASASEQRLIKSCMSKEQKEALRKCLETLA